MSGEGKGGYKLTGVEAFAAGDHRGEFYSAADIDDVVRNFDLFSSPTLAKHVLLRVPGVVGHDERKYLERTDLPAAGRVVAARRGWGRTFDENGKIARRPVLLLDLDGVPREFADYLRRGLYTTVSAELYPRPPGGFPRTAKGKVLRRLAFLGGEIPQVKGMADLPEPVRHSEAAPRRALRAGACYHDVRRGFVACFSEVVGMDRQAMLDRLAGHGVDVSALTDDVPDEALAELVRVLDAKDGEKDADDEPTPPHPMDMDEGWRDPADDAERAEYRERSRQYRERARKFAAKYGEDDAMPGGDDDDEDEEKKRKKREAAGAAALATGSAMKMSESQLAALIERKVAAALNGSARGAVAEVRKYHEDLLSAEKRRAVDGLIEGWTKAGKLPPVVREDVRKQLLEADSRAVVEKFSEKGKAVELTAYDRIRRTWDRMPSLFTERMPGGGAAGDGDAELERVVAFSENAHMASALKAAGKTPDDFVGGFKELQKKRPRVTAVEYGVPGDFTA